MSVTVKAAWITAAAILVSALIATIGTYYVSFKEQESKDHLGEDSLSSLFIDIPAGSTVIIRIKGIDEKETEKVEAVIERKVKEESQLKLLKLPPVSSIDREFQKFAESGLAKGEEYGRGQLVRANYLVLVDLDSDVSRVLDTETGEIISAARFKLQADDE